MRQKFCQTSFLSCGSCISLNDEKVLVGWGERTLYKTLETSNIPTFYFPDFFLTTKTPWFTHSSWAILTHKELSDLLTPNTLASLPFWIAPDKERFIVQFQRAQDLFEKDVLVKAVPYTFCHSLEKMNGNCLQRVLSHLFQGDCKQAFLYGFWDDQGGIVGKTPEILFTYDGLFKTMACAGTKKRSEKALAWIPDSKTMDEHRFVIEGIVNSLSPFGVTRLSDTKIVDFERLSHLITSIEVDLKAPFSFETIVSALHPTPALGTLPKEAGGSWLVDCNKASPRDRFGAPVGVLFAHQALCYVAIRNVQWGDDGMKIGAGCGIVKASHLESEWDEILLKIAATKNHLGL